MALDAASTEFYITNITGNEDRLFAFISNFVQDNKDAYTPDQCNGMSWIVEEIYGRRDKQDWNRDWRPMMAEGKLTFEDYDYCGCFETSEYVSKFATLLAEQIPEVGFKARVHVVFYATGGEFAETFKSAPGRSEVIKNYRNGGNLPLDDRYRYRDNKSITTVNIPEDWTEISDSAFECCKSLKRVNIPEGVTRIGNYAFEDCKSLMSIEIPSSVVEIGTGAFSRCESLKSVKLHEGLTKIGEGAFKKCDSLESFEIPNTVTEIGYQPFKECKSLKSLEVPEPLKTFGEASLSAPYVRFNGCRVDTIGSTAVGDRLPEKIWVEDIACLTPALRPAGAICFAEDPSGSERRRTSHLKYIEANASKLVNHTKNHPALLELMVKHGLIGEDGLPAQPDTSQAGGQPLAKEFEIAESTLVAYTGPGGDVSIPQGVTEIGEDAFWYCDALKSVNIPEGITKICDHAFKGCGQLESIEIPKNMAEIGRGAFECCGSLEATIESGCTALIGDWAFHRCKSVTVPKSVEKFGIGALSASFVRLPEVRAAITTYVFGDELSTRIWAEHLASLPAQMKLAAVLGFAEDPSGSEQRRASHIKYIKSHIPLTVANPSLLDLVIQERLITAKTLPAYLEEARKTENTEAVAKLMEYAETLQMPGSGRGRLDPPACQAQPGITQDSSVQSSTHNQRSTRGMEDFKTSKGVLIEYTGRDYNVAIPEGVTKIGKQAFSNCESLRSVTIPEGVTEINDGAFYSCKSLMSVSIPEGVTEIGKGAFKDCESLKSVAIPGSVTRIYGSAFSGCKSLETVAIPGSVTEIGGLAFDGCKSIHLNGNSLPVIGKGAFRGCKFIRINGNTPSAIGKDAFIYIPALGDMLPERIWVEDLGSLEPALKPTAVLGFAEDPSGSKQRRASHIKYIKSHIPLTVANPSLLDLVIGEQLITEKTLPAYLEEARKTENTEAVAKLMEYAETLQKPGSGLEL